MFTITATLPINFYCSILFIGPDATLIIVLGTFCTLIFLQ